MAITRRQQPRPGVSARTFASHTAALADVEIVRERAAGGEFEVEHVPSGLWWWRMRLDRTVVATSAHGFARRVDATLAGGRFRQRAPGAGAT